MGRYGDLDYPMLTKTGVLLGLGLFLLGAAGEWAVHMGALTVPAWEDTLLFDLEALGVLIFAFSPIVFGILLPLTE